MTALKRDLTIEVVHWSNMRRLCVIVGDALARMQLLFGTLDFLGVCLACAKNRC